MIEYQNTTNKLISNAAYIDVGGNLTFDAALDGNRYNIGTNQNPIQIKTDGGIINATGYNFICWVSVQAI